MYIFDGHEFLTQRQASLFTLYIFLFGCASILSRHEERKVRKRLFLIGNNFFFELLSSLKFVAIIIPVVFINAFFRLSTF